MKVPVEFKNLERFQEIAAKQGYTIEAYAPPIVEYTVKITHRSVSRLGYVKVEGGRESGGRRHTLTCRIRNDEREALDEKDKQPGWTKFRISLGKKIAVAICNAMAWMMWEDSYWASAVKDDDFMVMDHIHKPVQEEDLHGIGEGPEMLKQEQKV